MAQLSEKLNRKLMIGNRMIHNRLLLSPMAGLTHIALRELVSSYGGYGLLFTEMCNARALPQENRHLSPVFRWRNEELAHLVCQLFGSDPMVMAQAARRVEQEGFFGVDLNFGCSVSAICRKNCGAALLKDPNRAVNIVTAVRQAVSIPVFVKFRSGWQDDHRPPPQQAVELAARFEEAGADALVFHPRLAPDRRSRPPRREHITQIKAAVSIPVFGNGNVFDIDDASIMLRETGCDGLALGRIAVARPWVFAAFTRKFRPADTVYHDSALQMARLLSMYFDDVTALKRFKKYALYFSANFTFGHALYHRLCKADTMEQIKTNLNDLFITLPQRSARPNLSRFS
jgi:nifR3 family TIM-barrel protein